jgi:enoyl-[acyl-carrier-protein] reductase (NADH)
MTQQEFEQQCKKIDQQRDTLVKQAMAQVQFWQLEVTKANRQRKERKQELDKEYRAQYVANIDKRDAHSLKRSVEAAVKQTLDIERHSRAYDPESLEVSFEDTGIGLILTVSLLKKKQEHKPSNV